MHIYALVIRMPNMTIRIPEDLKKEIDNHPEINWSEVARQSMWSYIRKLEVAEKIAGKSKLTEKEAEKLGKDLKHDIAEHYRETT